MSLEQKVALRRGPYLGEISALCFLQPPPTHTPPSSLPYLLAGTGSELLLYNLNIAKLIKTFHVFGGIRVHGITCSSTTTSNNYSNNYINNKSISSSRPIEFVVAVFGERRVKLFKLSLQVAPNEPGGEFVDLNLLNICPKFTHWVLDVSFLKDSATAVGGDIQYLAIGCSDNSVHFWNSLSPQGLTKVLSPDRCLLYSMRMWGDKVENLHIASGTIYNQIIVWKVVPVDHHDQQYEAVHICKLAGHEGSILRIDWSSDGNRLISVSDDRSARLWVVYGDKKVLDSFSEALGSHSVGPGLFGHNARIWDCCIFENLIVTAGEDCTCRVWGPDGNQLQMIKEHIGRGIWRCLYDPNSSLLVTAGFDSSIKAQKLQYPLFKASGRHSGEVNGPTDRAVVFAVRIPRASEHGGLMNSKSEYVRCLHFACENILYVATNNGYLYLAKLSKTGDVKWTELVRVSEAVAIVCMDVLSVSSPDSSSSCQDWVACGDGKGRMTVVSIFRDRDGHSPKVGIIFTWSAGIERQLLGTYWCKSLGSRFIFNSDPKGILRLWRLGDPLQSASYDSRRSSDVSLIAKFVSCFGIRIMCLDASFEEEVLVCGDLRGNLVLFPLFKHLLFGTSFEPEKEIFSLNHFKSAHGISSVCSISVASFYPSQVEIQSTGADGCICSLEYDRSTKSLDFLGMKQVKEMSFVQCVSGTTSPDDLTSGSHAVGFSSSNFLIWNLLTETKVAQVPCGGWRRPYSYYLGNVPEIQNCFAFVKDEIINIQSSWVHECEREIYPQNLHLQFHGREMHSICIISEDSLSHPNKGFKSKTCWIATGCEDGTVRLTGYDPNVEEWCASKLLGEHVGGSSVRSLCYVSTVNEFDGDLSTSPAETTIQQVKENSSLLISVGAKRVLTCWKQKIGAVDLKKETVATKVLDETCSGIKFPSGLPSMSFQWLSSDLPTKQCSTREGRERISTEKKGQSDVSSNTDEGKLESTQCFGDEYENDWRYLAVTSFLVKISSLRLTVCYVVVACSDATLTLRALVLPHRLWFDVASLVPNSSPTLALQHVVFPVSATSNDNVPTKSVYLVIGGSTDGNITFWDLTDSVEKFIQSLPALQMKKSFDCQKRPRTGRGSQGGRWWKGSSQNISSLNPNSSCISGQITDITCAKIVNPNINGISSEATGAEICEINCTERKVWPLKVLNGVHQSGINCLYLSTLQNFKGSDLGNLYCVLSGGDDQALHSLVFYLQMLPLNQCTENKEQEIVCDTSIHEITNNGSNYTVRFCYHDKVSAAHSSAVKGIWTDGSWVFSTGLDQRIRCWLIEENGKLKEWACLIVSVPEPEALDAKPCGKDEYQIVVAGRGIQMVDFSTLGGVDDNGKRIDL